MSEGRCGALAGALAASCAALFAPLAWPLLTRRVFAGGDLEGFHLPLRHLYQQALLARDSLLWTPSIFSGYYIHGEGQAGMFHPLHLLLYRVFPLDVAFNLELIATYGAACAGMFLWLARAGLDRRAALFGAMLLAFSGFYLWHYQHVNVVSGLAHVPWLLLATDVLFEAGTCSSRAAGYAGVATVIASAVLVGAPQALWFTVLATATFTARHLRRTRLTRVVAFGFAVLTGVLLGGVQLLPTLDVLRRSIRAGLERDLALTFSLHPINLLQLWSPAVFLHRVYAAADPPFIHELTLYSGAFLAVAVAWIWIRRDAVTAGRPLLVPAIALAAVALALALGKYGGLGVAMTYVPWVGGLRAPARYTALVQFSLIVLAAVAFNDLTTIQRSGPAIHWKRAWPLWIPAMLSLATTILLNWRRLPVLREVPFSPARMAIRGTLLVVLVTTFVVLASRRFRGAMLALVVITAADIGWWGYQEVFRRPPRSIHALLDGIDAPSAQSPAESIFVRNAESEGNLLTLAGYRLASGYVGLPPVTHFHYSSSISRQLSGARWEYTPGGKVSYPAAVDRARLLTSFHVTDRIGRDWDKVDLHASALLDRDVGPLAGPPGQARVVTDRPGRIVVDVAAPGRQLLALTERYHDGWTAVRDGIPLQTVAIHGDFLGCVVDGGRTRVEFRFEPRSFTVGRAMTALGLLLLVASVAVMSRTFSP